jgi:hypothetical protein
MPHDRRSHRSLLLVTASVLAALLLVSAPAVATRASAQGGPNVLRIAQIEQVTNFDPALMSTRTWACSSTTCTRV